MYDRVGYIKNRVGCSRTSLFDRSIERPRFKVSLGFIAFLSYFTVFLSSKKHIMIKKKVN